jgi:glycosyltransferase involved in cell wall biosynthesis
MGRMKLCVIAPEFLPVWGGVGTYLVELVRHLPRNIEVHVVTPMRESIGRKRVSSRDFDFSGYFGDNVHVHFVCKATDTFFYNAIFQSTCLRYIPQLVNKENIDILHFGHHMAGLLLEFKGLEIPAVTTVHTTIQGQRSGTRMSGMKFWDLEFSEKATYLTYPFLRLAETIYFSRTRHYITVSEWMKKQLQEQYTKMNYSEISVVHNSVDTELFSPGPKRESIKGELILFTGRMIAGKGIAYLIKAIPEVLKEHSDAFFMFIGPGDFMPYRRRLKELGISEKNFAFLGYLKDRSELVEYYRTCSIFCAPTLWENLPIRVLEAMACGAPVIASNVCAIPEVVDNSVNGVLIPPCSVHELARAICCLLSDSNLRRKIGDNARKTVLGKFDCKVHAMRTAEVYQKVLDQY